MRDAREADAEGIMRVHVDCILKLCSSHYSEERIQRWSSSQSLERYISFIKDESDFVVVTSKQDDTVLAFGHMGKSREGFSGDINFEIFGFYVSPQVARRGVGKMLSAELERRALEQGARGIGVKSSLNAIPFYEACGFRQTAACGSCVGGRDVELECKPMEKVLCT